LLTPPGRLRSIISAARLRPIAVTSSPLTDYTLGMIVDNSDGATVRADVNDALKALATNSKSDAAPSTTFPSQRGTTPAF
jgi:hypothetical protein